MLLSQLKTTAPFAFVAAGLMACVAVAAVPPSEPPEPPHAATAKSLLFIAAYVDPTPVTVEPKPLPKGPNKLLFSRAGSLTTIDPDGKNEKKVPEDQSKFHPGNSKLSPDGKMVAVSLEHKIDNVPPGLSNGPGQLYVRELTEKEPGMDLGFACSMFFWSPDGTKIAATVSVGPPTGVIASHFLVDVKTKEKTAIGLPKNYIITDWSRDGKYFLTRSLSLKDGKSFTRICLMNMDGTEHKVLAEVKANAFGQLSPDGTRLLYLSLLPPKQNELSHRSELQILAIDTGKTTVVADQPLNGNFQCCCWSPDGKRIAYVWQEVHSGHPAEQTNKETESRLVTCDPDGKNPKTLASEKAQGQRTTIAHVDWR